MRVHLLIFFFLLCLVTLFHYLLDSKYLDFGMHSDDWISLIRYKALEVDILHKIQFYWRQDGVGPHATSQIIYMGILEGIYGLNYKMFALSNIIFKILATLSIYPLILLVFKRKLLAFLTVILYSISYSTIGTFHDVHKGTEYQAIFFMNIFLIIYYFITKKQNISFKWFCFLILSFSAAILLAPPRLFPLVLLPLLVEIFLWTHMRAMNKLKFVIKKLLLIYLPCILLLIYHPSSITGPFIVVFIHIQKILEGYWFIILNPLSGLGYMILWDSYWVKLISSPLITDNLRSYLIFIISHNLVIFGLISTIIALILSKNKKRFICLAIVVNFILELLTYYLATNHLTIPKEHKVDFNFSFLYSIFVGILVISLNISCYIEWLATGKKNRLILALWAGPLISLYFIFCNWLFADPFLSFVPSHEYLTVPAIGVSLMFAALLTFCYDKIKDIKIINLGQILAFVTLLLIFIPIYRVNKVRTTEWLSSIVKENNASQQKDLQQKIKEKVKDLTMKGDELFFFDYNNDKFNGGFYSENIYSSFTFWMHYNNGEIIEGCINGITDKTALAKSTTERGGKKGFLLPGVCVYTPSGDFFINQKVFYALENFYAFEISDNNLNDIRDKVLKDISIN